MTELIAMPIDPEHVHVYWHLAPQTSSEPMTSGPASSAQTLTLRFFNQPVAIAKSEATNQPGLATPTPSNLLPPWFDIPVDIHRNQQWITLPTNLAGACGVYQVALGRLNQQEEFTALAYSNTAIAPPAPVRLEERLSPMMAAFIMQPSQASSTLAANASGQHN